MSLPLFIVDVRPLVGEGFQVSYSTFEELRKALPVRLRMFLVELELHENPVAIIDTDAYRTLWIRCIR